MKNKDLQEYLEEFSSESDIAIFAVSKEKRIVYKSNAIVLAGEEIPAVVLEITGERDMDEEEKAVCEECERQPDLPALKNNGQRKQFLSSFRDWPIWFTVPQADETYYRYDLPDGSSIVICEYKQYLGHLKKYGRDPEMTYTREYLLQPGHHYLNDCRSSMSALTEHLKNMQKK